MDVEVDSGFSALISSISLVKCNTPQSFWVIRLVERVGQRRDGHPRFDPRDIRCVDLIAQSIRKLRLSQEPLEWSGWIPAATQAAHRHLFPRQKGQIAPASHGTQVHL